MNPKVKFISIMDPQAVFEIDQKEFSIGRSQECAMRIQDSSVSRLHASVRYVNGHYLIESLGQNPTYVNGVSVRNQFLQNGDRITLGRSEFIFQIGTANGIFSEESPVTDETETVIAASPTYAPSTPHMMIKSSLGDTYSLPLDRERFVIGRHYSCDIQLQNDMVSRQHAEIYFNGEKWCVRDLGSGNGTYLRGNRISEVCLHENSTLQLGSDGPILWLSFQGVAVDKFTAPDSTKEIAEHYFGDSAPERAGEHTLLVREAFQQIKKKHSQRYLWIIGTVVFLLTISVGIGVYQHIKLQQAKKVAIDIYYNMKTISLQIAEIEEKIQVMGESRRLEAEVSEKKELLLAMEKEYNTFIQDIGVVSDRMSEKDKIIYRVTRMFGECEVNMPDGFKKEVKKYIKKWQRSPRLKRAIHRIRANNYAPQVAETMEAYGLAPQFLYLALQESDFKEQAIGPKTRYGIAKGMWQFIPETARDYGLRVGPLAGQRKYDPLDQRFDFAAATDAAGRFLRDLYNTEAQASGLLVMASYNWGPTPIKRRIRKMPKNPKERNFWKLLESYRIPKETYDYVFSIVSAAVIGEDPKLFGFEFDSPFAHIEKES